MLQLRPSCENCNEPLPPESLKARICSFECTFCARCVEEVLANVCPNCGGGFCPRPIRPSRNWKGDNYVKAKPASVVVRHPCRRGGSCRVLGGNQTNPPQRK